MTITDKFFALLRLGLGLGTREDHSLAVAAGEWSLLYGMARAQGVLGIAFAGVQRLRKESYPPRELLMQWLGTAERIRKSNLLLNHECSELARLFESVGLDSCILKGQGLSRLYPDGGIRQTGDIDVWVKPRVVNFCDDINWSVGEIRKRLSAIREGVIGKATYHHIDLQLPRAHAEVHYRPQAFNNPLANMRFQHWCNAQWQRLMPNGAAMAATADVEFVTPDAAFNAVYLLAHMYHHLLFEGLIMKQVCDYAVLLCRNEELTVENEELERKLRSFGMLRFAHGIMWIMQEVFNITDEKLPVMPDENEGRFMLGEIMRERRMHPPGESTLGRFIRLTLYRSRFMFRYPSEIMWDIPFRLCHWFWRQRYA